MSQLEAFYRQLKDTKRTYPRTATIYSLIAAQPHKTPDNIAVAWNDKQQTYAALDVKNSSLAEQL